MAGLLRVFPHRTAPPESAVWSWWLDRGSGAVPCPTLLQGWDYTTELRLGLIVNVDLAKLFLATGLQRVEDLQVVALADCKSAQTRLSMSAPVVPDDHGGGSADLTFVVPPGTVAQSLRLTASLVLAADIAPTDRRVPTLKGSRLLDAESQTLLLEGDAGLVYSGTIPLERPGSFGYTVRVTPDHPLLGSRAELGLVATAHA